MNELTRAPDPVAPALSRRAWTPRVTVSRETATGWSVAWRATLFSRVIVWVAGLLALMWFGENINAAFVLDPVSLTAPFHSVGLDKLLAPAGRWDSYWYLHVAQQGYFSRQSSGFFPLYPMLVAVGMRIVDQPLLVGLAISLAALLAALTLLYKLAVLDLDEPAARLTVLLVAMFPTSLFLSADYSESVFLLGSVAAVFAARRERWAVAGLCGALAAGTRSNGVLLLVPLAGLYLYGPRTGGLARLGAQRLVPRFRLQRSAFWILLTPLGLLAYVGYMWATHDAPLVSFRVQEAYWGHYFTGPFGAVVVAIAHLPADVGHVLSGTGRHLGGSDPTTWSDHELIDLGFLVIAFWMLALGWRRLPAAYTAYSLVMLGEILTSSTHLEPLQSFSRYMLPLFPLFMALGTWLAPRPRATRGVVFVSALLLTIFSGLWGVWDWVA